MAEREPNELWIFGSADDSENSPEAQPPGEPGHTLAATRDPSNDEARPVEAPDGARPSGENALAGPALEPTEAPDLPLEPTRPIPTGSDPAGSLGAGRSSAPGRPIVLIIAGALVLVVLAVGATLAAVQHSSRETSASPSVAIAATSTPATPSFAASETEPSALDNTPEPGEDPSDSAPTTRPLDAKKRLEELSDEGVAQVSLDGQDVAMVASKWNGVRDPLQTAADGSHTFHYADILAEHERLAAEDNDGASLVMLRGTDYGKRRKSPDGKTIYVTFALGSWDTRDEVKKWCSRRFAGLSSAKRDDTCVPTKLTD